MRNSSIETLAAGGIVDETVEMTSEMWEFSSHMAAIHNTEVGYEIDCLKERVRILEDVIKWTSDPVIRDLAELRLKEATTRLLELKLIQ